jgi:hypothetical protein
MEVAEERRESPAIAGERRTEQTIGLVILAILAIGCHSPFNRVLQQPQPKPEGQRVIPATLEFRVTVSRCRRARDSVTTSCARTRTRLYPDQPSSSSKQLVTVNAPTAVFQFDGELGL